MTVYVPSTMQGQLVATCVGCNRVVGCLDWSEKGWVAFGAHNFIAIYDTKVTLVVKLTLTDSIARVKEW